MYLGPVGKCMLGSVYNQIGNSNGGGYRPTMTQIDENAFSEASITHNWEDLGIGDKFYIYISYKKSAASATPTITSVRGININFYKPWSQGGAASSYVFSPTLNVDQYPPPVDLGVIPTYWEYSGSVNDAANHIVSSVSLGQRWGSTQLDVTNSGFGSIVTPFTIQTGDEFRFEGTELYSYMVVDVVKPIDNGGVIKVKLDRDIRSGSKSLDHFLIRRYVDDGAMILFDSSKGSGASGPSLISPQYVTETLDKGIDEIILDLTNKGLIT